MEAAAKKDADMAEKYAGTSSGNGSNFAFLMIAALLAVIAVLVSERSMLIKALEEDGKTFTLF